MAKAKMVRAKAAWPGGSCLSVSVVSEEPRASSAARVPEQTF